jgi:hypothetical protein
LGNGREITETEQSCKRLLKPKCTFNRSRKSSREIEWWIRSCLRCVSKKSLNKKLRSLKNGRFFFNSKEKEKKEKQKSKVAKEI